MSTGHNPLKDLLELMRKELYGETPEGCCVKCKKPFSSENVFMEAGWKDTKISKLCEVCWEIETKEPEEEI